MNPRKDVFKNLVDQDELLRRFQEAQRIVKGSTRRARSLLNSPDIMDQIQHNISIATAEEYAIEAIAVKELLDGDGDLMTRREVERYIQRKQEEYFDSLRDYGEE